MLTALMVLVLLRSIGLICTGQSRLKISRSVNSWPC
jgi:hypothetical protein